MVKSKVGMEKHKSNLGILVPMCKCRQVPGQVGDLEAPNVENVWVGSWISRTLLGLRL